MWKSNRSVFLLVVLLITASLSPALSQDNSGRKREVQFGSKAEIKGVIVERSGDNLTIRDYLGRNSSHTYPCDRNQRKEEEPLSKV